MTLPLGNEMTLDTSGSRPFPPVNSGGLIEAFRSTPARSPFSGFRR